MCIRTSLLILLTFFTCQKTKAQGEPAIVPNAQPVGPQKPVQQYYVEDGGAHGGVLESIVVPPKLNAPFTLLLQTEWVRGLPDGGTITTVNERRIARDTEGRIYEERWYLVPKGGKVKSEMTTIQISDPANHTLYNCFMLEPKKQCVLVPYTPSPNAVFMFQGPPTGPPSGSRASTSFPDGSGEAIHEDLGNQLVEGVETTGTRDTVVYNAGLFGNDRKMTIEREYWYSPKLGFNLLSKRSDPRIGTQTFTATNLILSEPDPKLFDLPEGFKVVDRRPTAAPQY
jgi:hypothetical protein